MTEYSVLIEALHDDLRSRGIELRIRNKPDYASRWHRFLGLCSLALQVIGTLSRTRGRERWGARLTTVFGYTIYLPKGHTWRGDNAQDFMLLVHEAVHAIDRKRWGPLFGLTYILPPLLLTFRSMWEWRAYREDLAFRLALLGEEEATWHYMRTVKPAMRGSLYLWMDPIGLTGWRRWAGHGSSEIRSPRFFASVLKASKTSKISV